MKTLLLHIKAIVISYICLRHMIVFGEGNLYTQITQEDENIYQTTLKATDITYPDTNHKTSG